MYVIEWINIYLFFLLPSDDLLLKDPRKCGGKKKAASGERENDDIRALCMCCLSLFYFVMIGESGGSLDRWLFLLLYTLQTHTIWYSSERPQKEEKESRNGLSIKLCINGIFIFVCRFEAGPRVEHGQSIKDFFLFFLKSGVLLLFF